MLIVYKIYCMIMFIYRPYVILKSHQLLFAPYRNWLEHYFHRYTPAVGNGNFPFLIGNSFDTGQMSIALLNSHPSMAKANAAAAGDAATNGTAGRLRWALRVASKTSSGWWVADIYPQLGGGSHLTNICQIG